MNTEIKTKLNEIKQVVILSLSLFVVLELAVEVILSFPPNIQNFFNIVDFIICMIFIADFFFFLLVSKNKWKYIKTNWFDLVSAIPFTAVFRLLRVLRIVRIVRLLKLIKLLRGIKAIRPITTYITQH